MHRFKKKQRADDQPPGSAIVVMAILGLIAIALALLMCGCNKQEITAVEAEAEKIVEDVIEQTISEEVHSLR